MTNAPAGTRGRRLGGSPDTTARPSVPSPAPPNASGRPVGLDAVRAVIARHDSLPIYASTEWQALEPGDPRWIASCLRAAECWRLHHEPAAVAARLDEDTAVMARRIRGASWDVSAGWRDRRANPPGPWPADATVPAGFYGRDWPVTG